VVNNDYHAPGDRVSAELAKKILAGAGLNESEIIKVFENNKKVFLRSLED